MTPNPNGFRALGMWIPLRAYWLGLKRLRTQTSHKTFILITKLPFSFFSFFCGHTINKLSWYGRTYLQTFTLNGFNRAKHCVGQPHYYGVLFFFVCQCVFWFPGLAIAHLLGPSCGVYTAISRDRGSYSARNGEGSCGVFFQVHSIPWIGELFPFGIY